MQGGRVWAFDQDQDQEKNIMVLNNKNISISIISVLATPPPAVISQNFVEIYNNQKFSIDWLT